MKDTTTKITFLVFFFAHSSGVTWGLFELLFVFGWNTMICVLGPRKSSFSVPKTLDHQSAICIIILKHPFCSTPKHYVSVTVKQRWCMWSYTHWNFSLFFVCVSIVLFIQDRITHSFAMHSIRCIIIIIWWCRVLCCRGQSQFLLGSPEWVWHHQWWSTSHQCSRESRGYH